MKYLYAVPLIVILLTACGPTATPGLASTDVSPSPTSMQGTASPSEASPTAATTHTAAIPTNEQPTPTVAVLPTSTSMPATNQPGQTTEAPASTAEQTVEWQDLMIRVPANHRWETSSPNQNMINDAPVLAYGRIVFVPSAATSPVELPEGLTFTIVEFSGSVDQWLAREEAAAADTNPVDRNTIQNTTVAGKPAIAYSYAVTGVSRSQSYIIKIGADRLLLINNSDADNPDYQAVIDTLKIVS